jgi:hypothetical protein
VVIERSQRECCSGGSERVCLCGELQGAGDIWIGKQKKVSSSFLKKRTKKLLIVPASVPTFLATLLPRQTSKSLLVLFFRKELLPFCLTS